MAIALVIILPLYLLYAPVKISDVSSKEVVIKQGEGLSIIAENLSVAGLLRSKLLFVAYVKLRGEENSLKAGRYLLSRSFNTPLIVSMIAEGRSQPDDVIVTIPEGFNIWEVDKRISASGLTTAGLFAKEYLNKEGHLFPDTYNFKKDASIKDIADKIEQNYSIKAGAHSEETLIIASLLEKEAKTKEDMELVAGIIQKRLKIGIPLQIDASVGYGWCLKESTKPTFKGFCYVTQAPIAMEIKIDGPYNTYIQKGLPSGPISNPGLIAIQAAENPKESDYLYYLSTRDGSQLIFSKTAGEHAANRRKYLGI